ncbi:MAG: sigma-54-dependent Fis family transcriptional regulator [Gammaproteobacteria bacterium]|nr:MAG: sigma-54-dependent Fis family transcriptional regulator [Gammaproteobacteria bacterium]
MASGNILVVDDELEIRQLVRDILEDEGYDVHVADGAEQARAANLERKPDLVLLDIWMPGTDGISLLKEWKEQDDLPFQVIIMSGHGTVETAVEATRLGAYDFLEKPLSLAKLLLTVERAIDASRLRQENIGLRGRTIELNEPIGHSKIMTDLRQQADSVSRHDSAILLTGEPGTGKETLARYIHQLSSRHEEPFITLRIGAIASENSESAIFGREHDSQVYYGHLEQAHGGTLFIDEVVDMNLETQGRLLSALQESEFLRVDGTQPISVDVRVIASTRTDLEQAVRDGHFRDDLYYFLNVLPIHIAPLREHSEDIPDLINFYTDHFVRSENLPSRTFNIAAQNSLRNYAWPGNIREMKNLIQRLLILGHDNEISDDDVRRATGTSVSVAQPPSTDLQGDLMNLPLREAREAFERSYLLYQWQQADGSVGQLAKNIGMERTHLYRKLKGLGIDHKKPTTNP